MAPDHRFSQFPRYDQIDDLRVWVIIQDRLPELVDEVAEVITDIDLKRDDAELD